MTVFFKCPGCNAEFSLAALQKKMYRCPGCGKKKTSRPWQHRIEE